MCAGIAELSVTNKRPGCRMQLLLRQCQIHICHSICIFLFLLQFSKAYLREFCRFKQTTKRHMYIVWRTGASTEGAAGAKSGRYLLGYLFTQTTSPLTSDRGSFHQPKGKTRLCLFAILCIQPKPWCVGRMGKKREVLFMTSLASFVLLVVAVLHGNPSVSPGPPVGCRCLAPGLG